MPRPENVPYGRPLPENLPPPKDKPAKPKKQPKKAAERALAGASAKKTEQTLQTLAERVYGPRAVVEERQLSDGNFALLVITDGRDGAALACTGSRRLAMVEAALRAALVKA